jgi:hypothetical protein
MSEGSVPAKNGRFATASWVAIVVGVAMLATGVIFDIDARSVNDSYKRLADIVAAQNVTITGLLQTAVTNATNIANLTSTIHEVKMMVEDHVIKDNKK